MNGIVAAVLMLTAGVHPVEAAEADSARLNPDYACYTRYLRLDNIDANKRADYINGLCLHVASLSHASEIVPPYVVPGTNNSLVRINTMDQGEVFAKVYERLESPWDRQLVQELAYEPEYQEFGVYRGDVLIRTEKKVVGKKLAGKKQESRPAFWLTDTPALQAKYNKLIERLQTNAPIVRADWFMDQSGIQEDRSPTGYYDFLGIKTETDFQLLGDFDAKRKLKRVEFRAAVGISSVTTQPRGLERLDAPGTAYWRSFDFGQALKKTNPLRVFGRALEDAFRDPAIIKKVASEQYVGLPNDMWATCAAQNDGKLQDSAPNFAAGDKHGFMNDFRVHVGLGCLRCHKKGGLQDIDDWAKDMFPPPLELTFAQIDEARLFRQQYGRDLQKRIEMDRQPYTAVVKRWTGWTTEQYSDKMAAIWEEYERPVDLERAARFLNTTPDTLWKAIDATVKAKTADNVLSLLILKGNRARAIPIRQFEELVPIAHLALRGLQPPK